MKKRTSQLLLSFLALFSMSAHAHFPLMSCWFEADKVICEAGYSDGSTAVDYDVDMFDYDDNLIAKSITDRRSIAEFKRPIQIFILFLMPDMKVQLKLMLSRFQRNDHRISHTR